MSDDQLARFREAGLTLAPVTRNPIDAAWPDRPAPPTAAAIPHNESEAGESAAAKRTRPRRNPARR